MKLRNVIYLLIILFIGFGCNSDPKKVNSIDPNESALPHGKALPAQALSKSDLIELKNAKGKKAITISLLQLKKLLSVSNKRLNCFLFWKSSCDLCQKIVKQLEEKEMHSPNLVISLITDESDLESLDLFIRKENIVPKVYHLKTKNKKWSQLVNKDWDGSFPAILIKNKAENINHFFSIKSMNEFEALISPLLP